MTFEVPFASERDQFIELVGRSCRQNEMRIGSRKFHRQRAPDPGRCSRQNHSLARKSA